MNETHKQILKLLWDFQSLTEEQILKICNCSENDINYLIAKKAIVKDKQSNIIRYKTKEISNKNIVAFEVVMNYLDRNPKILKAKYPVNVTIKTDKYTYDIICIKEIEINTLFERIDELSLSDRIIIIIETKQYIRRKINTNRPCYICTYSPLKIIDRIN